MKILIIVLAFLFSVSFAQAKDIQLLNPDFFGQPTSNSIKLLYDKKADEIQPYMVTTDIKCGKYFAASVYYSKKRVSFAEVRESLNKLYKGYENLALLKESKIAMWRVDNMGFTIQLSQEEKRLCISYIQFQSIKELSKGLMKISGTEIDADNDNECK